MMKQKLIIIYSFFNYCYKETFSLSSGNLGLYLNTISFLKLAKEKSETLDHGITEKELFIVLQSMENNKSSGNDGLTKEFYIIFWNEVKIPLLPVTENAKQLSASQKQAVIRLIGKKGHNNRYIQNWQPISLLNIDVKLISIALAEHLKKVLLKTIFSCQNARVKDRFISEGGKLIYDLLEMSEVINEGFLVTADSVNHLF